MPRHAVLQARHAEQLSIRTADLPDLADAVHLIRSREGPVGTPPFPYHGHTGSRLRLNIILRRQYCMQRCSVFISLYRLDLPMQSMKPKPGGHVQAERQYDTKVGEQQQCIMTSHTSR